MGVGGGTPSLAVERDLATKPICGCRSQIRASPQVNSSQNGFSEARNRLARGHALLDRRFSVLSHQGRAEFFNSDDRCSVRSTHIQFRGEIQ
jgi:hypothetical protein